MIVRSEFYPNLIINTMAGLHIIQNKYVSTNMQVTKIDRFNEVDIDPLRRIFDIYMLCGVDWKTVFTMIKSLVSKMNEGCKILRIVVRLGIPTTEVRRQARACARNSSGPVEHEQNWKNITPLIKYFFL